MSKKRNEILEQQKRAQAEFLRLKKMQSGELAPPPKPSEEAVLPQTKQEKAQNFWYHYKWHTIAALFLAVVLCVIVTQCATKEKFDIQMVVFANAGVLDAQTEAMEQYFENFCPDFDGNGKVNVKITNCSYLKTDLSNPELNNSMARKLQGFLIGQRQVVLYIVDKENLDYLNSLPSENPLFMDDKVNLKKDFYSVSDIYDDIPLPKNLILACRYYPDDALKTMKISEAHQKGVNLLTLTKEKNK